MRLLAPRWLIAHVVVLAIGVACVVLGFWQLDRLAHRREGNAVHASRYAQPPMDLVEMLEQAAGDIDSLEYRRATVSGEFAPEDEVLIRSQVSNGQAGFDVVTPLVLGEGLAVAVNRGWVPLEFDSVPVTAAAPPAGHTEVQGIVRRGESRGTLGRDDTTQGRASTLSRIDLALIASQVDQEMVEVYLEVVGESAPTVIPVPPTAPDFVDDGPHRDYAIQWFSFALVGALGYGFLLRRAWRSG